MKVQFYGDVRIDDFIPVLFVNDRPRLPRRRKYKDGYEAQRYGHMLKKGVKMFPHPLNENDEEEKTQELADLLTAVKCLLVNGEKRAAILLIEKVFPDN